ncbi:MAG: signal peptidase I [Bacilli bacterium]|nr:signal peptidase I [Bacilli bacterium]
MKKIIKIFNYIITFFLVIVLLMVIFQKVTNSKVTIGNFYIFQVVSESMYPEYKIGDVIVVRKVDADKLKIGDDVTYLATSHSLDGLVITHRLIDIENENGEYRFTTKGIANSVADPKIKIDNIYGKVIYHTIIFSFIGRLMTNIIIYYALFIFVGVGLSYDIISSFLIKKDEDDDD